MKLTDKLTCQECGKVELAQENYPDDWPEHHYEKYTQAGIALLPGGSVGFSEGGHICDACCAAMTDEELDAAFIRTSALSPKEQERWLADQRERDRKK